MPSLPKQSVHKHPATHGDLPLSQAISPARVVAVCGGESGAGKTTLVTNLGFVLADKGQRVCLFDADTSLSNVGMQLGVSPSYSFADYVRASAELESALWSVSDGVQLMPGAGHVEDFAGLHGAQRRRLSDGLHRLEAVFDYVLVDCASGESEAQLQLIQASPFVVLVVTDERQSQREALALLQQLKQRGFGRPVMLVVNQTASAAAAQAGFQRFEKAARSHLQLRVHFLGYMQRDACVGDALYRHMPFVRLCPDSMATHHLEVIAHRLHQVACGTRSAGGQFSAFFDALQLADEVQERSLGRKELMRQLGLLTAGMDRLQFAAMIREVISLWESRSGERFDRPSGPPAETPPATATAASCEELPVAAAPTASSRQSPAPTAPPHQAAADSIQEHPSLQVVENAAVAEPAPRQDKGDGLKAAASVAAKVGSL